MAAVKTIRTERKTLNSSDLQRQRKQLPAAANTPDNQKAIRSIITNKVPIIIIGKVAIS